MAGTAIYCMTHSREHQLRDRVTQCATCGRPTVRYDGRCAEHSVCTMVWRAPVDRVNPLAGQLGV